MTEAKAITLFLRHLTLVTPVGLPIPNTLSPVNYQCNFSYANIINFTVNLSINNIDVDVILFDLI